MITLYFHHDPDDWISRLMAWFTRSRYTHVALLSPGGDYVLEATGASDPTGVRYLPTWLWQSRHPDCIARVAETPDAKTVWRLAETQADKPYDWGYLLGFLLRRNWQDQDKWVCHELIAWACAEAGTPLLDMTDAHFLTPDHLYRVTQPIKE